ncbi:hypothetical protein [Aestuariivivens sediminicola]|uniref:hypothetical protein n=1 Tax=Aestuariivivens sediminicola TaxID=2913560 RepID=UPI001F59E5FB|nr:hypothetical protein [Aestuariivivens sediminicola]
MKKLFLGLLMLFSFQTFSQNNFRAMNWDDSISDLKSQYPDIQWIIEAVDELKMYITDDYVGGLKVYVSYMFVDGKLKGGAYNFMEEHSSDNLYHEDFLSISDILNKKYEMEREEKWNKTTWKNNPDYIGHALRMGDVEITETYGDEDTLITHAISSNSSGDITHMLFYADIDYMKAKRNSVVDDF